MDNLRESLTTARAKGVEVRGIAVINPGNPTGNILAEEQIKDIIEVRQCERYFLREPEISCVYVFHRIVSCCHTDPRQNDFRAEVLPYVSTYSSNSAIAQ